MCSIFRSLLHVIILGSIVSGLEDLPAYLPRCKRTDPNMKECLLKATEEIRPYVRKGVPDFLPAFQSFAVPEIVLEQGTETLSYKAHFENVTLLGLDGYKFSRYELTKNLTFFLEVELPNLFLGGNYRIDGKILDAPIKGDGNFHVNISDTLCSIYNEATLVSINGIDYLRSSNVIPNIRVGKVIDFDFEGLFKENKELAEPTNKVLKDNVHVIAEDLLPTIEELLKTVYANIFSSVTQVPYDKLYPK